MCEGESHPYNRCWIFVIARKLLSKNEQNLFEIALGQKQTLKWLDNARDGAT